jgi:hypothetical protein
MRWKFSVRKGRDMKRMWKVGHLVAGCDEMNTLTRTGAITGSTIVVIGATVLSSTLLTGLEFAAFVVLSVIMLMLDLLPQIRLKQLKKKGNDYNAEIIDVRPGFFGKLECAYINERGERILFRTRPHIIKRNANIENLQVKIFVNRHEPRRYEVEIFHKKG